MCRTHWNLYSYSICYRFCCIRCKIKRVLGLPFIAISPAIAIAIRIYLFGNTSMTHFNPAVTVAFLITKHLERKKGLLLIYLLAEIIGGILASVFIYFIFGNEANLGG